MRKMMLASLVALIAATFFYVGCKRENSQEKVNDVSKQKIIAKVDAWLEGQKNVLDQKGNERIKALTKNLDFTNLRTELISDEEQFIIIPIKDNFKPVNTRNIVVVNNLVLVITKEETFSKGNIVQYQPASEQHDIDVLSRNIFNIYTGKKVLRSGEFAFFTVFGKPLYKLNYKNGTMNAHSVAEPKKATPAANGPDPDPISPAPICTDWYWVTTYFYEDGHTETTSTFAFTTCESTSGGGGSVECCIPDQNIVLTSTSISEAISDDCGLEGIDRSTGKSIKTCTHSWYFSTNTILWYTWKYISYEQADLEKEAGVWKFKTVTHNGMGTDGAIPPCVNATCTINSATPSISADRIQAQMNINYSVSTQVTCTPWASPISRARSQSTQWNAK